MVPSLLAASQTKFWGVCRCATSPRLSPWFDMSPPIGLPPLPADLAATRAPLRPSHDAGHAHASGVGRWGGIGVGGEANPCAFPGTCATHTHAITRTHAPSHKPCTHGHHFAHAPAHSHTHPSHVPSSRMPPPPSQTGPARAITAPQPSNLLTLRPLGTRRGSRDRKSDGDGARTLLRQHTRTHTHTGHHTHALTRGPSHSHTRHHTQPCTHTRTRGHLPRTRVPHTCFERRQ